jgi:hypothetical protein
MYYEEKWIEDKLFWRGCPGGAWVPFSDHEYRHRLISLLRNKEESKSFIHVTLNEYRSRCLGEGDLAEVYNITSEYVDKIVGSW